MDHLDLKFENRTPQRRAYAKRAPSCPKCLRELDGVVNPSRPNAQPKPGDYTICCYCRALLEFAHDLNLMPVTDETAVKVAGARGLTLAHELVDWSRNDGKKTPRREPKRIR